VAVRLPAERRRQQLLDVALEVFAASGFHEVSMDEVAEAAGVSKPVLYRHFENKRELYLELLTETGRRLIDTVVRATGAAPGPREQVTAGFTAYFRFVADHESAFRLLFGTRQPDEELAEVAARVEETVAEAVAALIEANLDDEHRRLLAHGVVGLAEATSRYWVDHGLSLEPERLARRVANLAWAGLRAVHRD